MIFDKKKINALHGDIVYLCDYIPKSCNDLYWDKRSDDLVISFKDKTRNLHKKAIETVADYLEDALSGNCALVAIPSSKTDAYCNSSVHELIHKIVEDIGDKRNIIDASDCLYRLYDIPSQHKQKGKRDISVLLESTGIQNTEKIVDRDILVIDDITTSGNSFKAAVKILKESGAANIISFAVGKRITPENLGIGFIIDIDGTLFNSDTKDIRFNRQHNQWPLAKEKAGKLEPFEGAKTLFYNINILNADYRIVTNSPSSYAYILTDKLGIPRDKVIAYHDTKAHKPSIEPYMAAKQQMQLYEPCIVVIGNEETDMIPARKLDMTSVLIAAESMPSATYCYRTIEDCCNHFFDITKRAYKVWKLLTTEYENSHCMPHSIKVLEYNYKKGEGKQ